MVTDDQLEMSFFKKETEKLVKRTFLCILIFPTHLKIVIKSNIHNCVAFHVNFIPGLVFDEQRFFPVRFEQTCVPFGKKLTLIK